MFCRQCGKELPDGVKFCPACGAEVNPAQEAPKPEPMQPVDEAPNTSANAENTGKWNVLAIVSFSIAVACVLGYLAGGFFLHIVTLILSIVSLTQFRYDPTMKGKGFAVAGTVISSVSVGLSVIGTIVYLIMTMLGIVATGVIGGIFNEIFKEIFSSSVLLPTLFF